MIEDDQEQIALLQCAQLLDTWVSHGMCLCFQHAHLRMLLNLYLYSVLVLCVQRPLWDEQANSHQGLLEDHSKCCSEAVGARVRVSTTIASLHPVSQYYYIPVCTASCTSRGGAVEQQRRLCSLLCASEGVMPSVSLPTQDTNVSTVTLL